MRRREFLGSAAAPLLNAAPARPNVVLIVADDLGYGELGCQGNPQIPTPHIDSIARRGVRFTNGYVTAPVCSPSRAGLLTGRYQTRFGHEFNMIGPQNRNPDYGLPLDQRTVAQDLKEAGYRTGIFGKWHLGGTEPYHPLSRGFDEFFGFLHEGHFYGPEPYSGLVSHLRKNEPPYDRDNPLLRGREPVREPEYLTRAIAREALAFLDRHHRTPFFLYVPFNSVHSPMQAEARDLERFASIEDPHRRMFAAMLSSLDQAVGWLLERIERYRLGPDTLIVFLSDNGGPVAELTSSNEPLRGEKGQLYEGGIRIPFLMQWPSRFRGGQVRDEPVLSCDLAATIRAACLPSVPPPADGIDLLPALGRNKPLPARKLFWRYGHSAALRSGDWKIVRQAPMRAPQPQWEMYDLKTDRNEISDESATRPDVLNRLRAEWEEMNHGMTAPRWGT